MGDKEKPVGLDLMRVPFDEKHISKLPKPTKRQTDEVKQDFKKGIRCNLCGGWHHPDVVHLDYVGHAALTDRLLECDPQWNWEPVAFTDQGTPAIDNNGGMWIRLTVCGVTRLGYGHPDGKTGGNAVKELIGDALRNAAMRFGAALDLWHKGDLHGDDEPDMTEDTPNNKEPKNAQNKLPDPPQRTAQQVKHGMLDFISESSAADIKNAWDQNEMFIADLKKMESVHPAWFLEIKSAAESKCGDAMKELA